jgi:hypothetical protein
VRANESFFKEAKGEGSFVGHMTNDKPPFIAAGLKGQKGMV